MKNGTIFKINVKLFRDDDDDDDDNDDDDDEFFLWYG